MNPKKDIIYVDIEDDITSIIGKTKAAKASIVALVPPKRIGVLQSVVNLKLLKKAAASSDKRIVLISTDNSLNTLAAGLRIPVAKNLQTKPELLPQRAPLADKDDEIVGNQLPVGELAAAAEASNAPDADDGFIVPTGSSQAGPLARSSIDKPAKKSGLAAKVPDFDRFRKYLFLIIGGAVLLLAFLVWAIFFAPRATVSIQARTTIENINLPLKLGDAATNTQTNTVKSVNQQTIKTQTIDFAPTGKKEVGEKATGTMTLTNASDSESVVIAGGTVFTAAGGRQFSSNTAATVPGAKVSGGQIVGGTATVPVTAVSIGDAYNLPSQSYQSSDSSVSAVGSQMNGGASRTVSVVTGEDVDKAKQKLAASDTAAVKAQLRAMFEASAVIIINESFVTSTEEPSVVPAIDQEASSAKLTAKTTYDMQALARTEVAAVLDAYLKAQINGQDKKRIYENGENKVRFSAYERTPGGSAVRLLTTGYIGPNIDETKLKGQLVGKRFGEIEQIVQGTGGIENVDVKFFPFWVQKAPSADKITVKFEVKKQ